MGSNFVLFGAESTEISRIEVIAPQRRTLVYACADEYSISYIDDAFVDRNRAGDQLLREFVFYIS